MHYFPLTFDLQFASLQNSEISPLLRNTRSDRIPLRTDVRADVRADVRGAEATCAVSRHHQAPVLTTYHFTMNQHI